MKCLLAAESVILRRIFRNAVEPFEFEEVFEATDGKHALALCDETTSLVVTARDLPLLDGLELTKKIRESGETSGISVLVIAERKSREDLMQAAQAGVNGYMIKPLSLPTLRAKIERLLQSAGLKSGEDGDLETGDQESSDQETGDPVENTEESEDKGEQAEAA